jgi:hypothetical protein
MKENQMNDENRWAKPIITDVEWTSKADMPGFLKEKRVQRQLLDAVGHLVLVAADATLHRIVCNDEENGLWCWTAGVFILQRDHFTGAVGGSQLTSIAIHERGDTPESVRDEFAQQVVRHIQRTRQGEVRFV